MTARVVAGPYVRPGAPAVLEAVVENSGESLDALVRIRTRTGRSEASFAPSEHVRLERGSNALEIVFIPDSASAGTRFEVLDGRAAAEPREPLFRADLSRVLRPLEPSERLVIAVGARALPLAALQLDSRRVAVSALEARELPTRDEAYAAADLVVVEEADRASVSAARADALARYLLGGGKVVFASFRALGAFERALFGAGPAPRTWADWPGGASGAIREEGLPERVELPFGLGRLVVFAAEPGDPRPWGAPTAGFLSGFLAARAEPWLDPDAFEALAPERPFAAAASRGRTAAIVGGLLAGVAASLLSRARRRLALAALAAVAIAWALVVTLIWGPSPGSARLLRVRLFTADGRAEVVTDTAVLTSLGAGTLGFECGTGPPIAVARRVGEAAAYSLVEHGGVWRALGAPAGAGEHLLFRTRSVRSRVRSETDADSELVTRVLSRGSPARLLPLPEGTPRCDSAGEEIPGDIRHMLERSGARAGELAWVWQEGVPEGLRTSGGVELAPGSGTLFVAERPQGP